MCYAIKASSLINAKLHTDCIYISVQERHE